MDEIIADFNTQYPGAVPPSRKTIWWGDIDLRRHSSGFILDRWGEIPAFLAFWGDLQFWMGIWNVLRWNGLKILILKHMWKSEIGPLQHIWVSKRYGTFFLGHPVVEMSPFEAVDPGKTRRPGPVPTNNETIKHKNKWWKEKSIKPRTQLSESGQDYAGGAFLWISLHFSIFHSIYLTSCLEQSAIQKKHPKHSVSRKSLLTFIGITFN